MLYIVGKIGGDKTFGNETNMRGSPLQTDHHIGRNPRIVCSKRPSTICPAPFLTAGQCERDL